MSPCIRRGSTQWHPQHAKALSVFLGEVLVVHLVCATDGAQVADLRVGEHLDRLVDEQVMDKEGTSHHTASLRPPRS